MKKEKSCIVTSRKQFHFNFEIKCNFFCGGGISKKTMDAANKTEECVT